MSRLSSGGYRTALCIFMGLLAYLVTPATKVEARTCGVLSNSFSCMTGVSAKKAKPQGVKVAAISPTNKVSDVTPVVTTKQKASKKKASKKAKRKKYKKTYSKKRKSRKRKASRKSRSKSYRKSSRRAKKKSYRRKARSSKRSSRRSGRRVVKKGWRTRNRGGQYMIARRGVKTSCFPAKLRNLLKKVSKRFGKKLIITSGYRSRRHNRRIGGARRSQHIHCTAADFYIPGVNKMAVARYMKRLPGRGGVGTYCGNRTVHLDVGPKRSWHWACRKRRYAKKRRAKRRYSAIGKRSSKKRVASRSFRGSKS